MSQEIKVSHTLSVDYGLLSGKPFVAIHRVDGGRVVLDVDEIKALVDALQDATIKVMTDYMDKKYSS